MVYSYNGTQTAMKKKELQLNTTTCMSLRHTVEPKKPSSKLPEKTLIRKDTCTPMFTAALFTIVKTWKQPKCPSTDE